jgi:hypothetical protein
MHKRPRSSHASIAAACFLLGASIPASRAGADAGLQPNVPFPFTDAPQGKDFWTACKSGGN